MAGVDGRFFSISESSVNQSVSSDLIGPLIAFSRAIEQRHLKPKKEGRAKRNLRKIMGSLPEQSRGSLFDEKTREDLSAKYRDELSRIEDLVGLTKFKQQESA